MAEWHIHGVLSESGLHITDEVFIRLRINLLGLPRSSLNDIKLAEDHLACETK